MLYCTFAYVFQVYKELLDGDAGGYPRISYRLSGGSYG